MTDPSALLDQWSDLFAQADGAGLTDLYTSTAIFLGSTPDIRRGRTEVADYFEALKDAPSPSVAFSGVVIETLAEGVVDLACFAAFGIGDAAPVKARISWTLVEEDGRWRIASHHASPLPGG